MSMTSEFLELTKIKHPIIQAPMAGGPTTPALVSGVSKAGALGSFGAAYMTPESLEKDIDTVKNTTTEPFQVNLFIPENPISEQRNSPAIQKLNHLLKEQGLSTWERLPEIKNNYETLLNVTIEKRVPIISFVFGIPDYHIIQTIHSYGGVVIGTATSVEEAIQIEQAGIDIVVLQGLEAGGHYGCFDPNKTERHSLVNLLQEALTTITVPIVVAGGIMNGHDIGRYLDLGASAVQMGSAFLGCPEANITDSWRDALKQSKDNTVLTKAFSGRYARGIKNQYIELFEGENDIPPFPIMNSMTKDLRTKAKKENNPDYQSLWAGQNAYKVREISAQELVKTLVKEINVSLRP